MPIPDREQTRIIRAAYFRSTAPVAQWIEQPPPRGKVVGLTPTWGTDNKARTPVGVRASSYGGGWSAHLQLGELVGADSGEHVQEKPKVGEVERIPVTTTGSVLAALATFTLPLSFGIGIGSLGRHVHRDLALQRRRLAPHLQG